MLRDCRKVKRQGNLAAIICLNRTMTVFPDYYNAEIFIVNLLTGKLLARSSPLIHSEFQGSLFKFETYEVVKPTKYEVFASLAMVLRQKFAIFSSNILCMVLMHFHSPNTNAKDLELKQGNIVMLPNVNWA